jgi:hypothetical protein
LKAHLLFLLGFSFPMVASGTSIVSQDFNSLTWSGSSATGYTEYSVTTTGPVGLEFVNVVDSTGQWLVQNMPIYEPGLESMVIGGFVSGSSVETFQTANALVSAPVYSSSSASAYSTTGPATYMANDANGIDGAGTFSDPGAAPTPGSVTFANNNLLGFTYHLGVPDLQQGKNQCAPTSAADSLSWLNTTYNLGINQTTQQIRDTLVTDMHTTVATGTSDANFIAGKNLFDANLPIATHVIGSIGKTPNPQDIFNQLAMGQDVELSVLWSGKGGHWVDLVGMIQIDGVYGIFYNDPARISGGAGTNFSWLTNDNSTVQGFGSANTIDTTIAESVVPEPSALVLACGALLGFALMRKHDRAPGRQPAAIC